MIKNDNANPDLFRQRLCFASIKAVADVEGFPVPDLRDHVPDRNGNGQVGSSRAFQALMDYAANFAHKLIDVLFLFFGRVKSGFIKIQLKSS